LRGQDLQGKRCANPVVCGPASLDSLTGWHNGGGRGSKNGVYPGEFYGNGGKNGPESSE
jgi:hypothetical protein